MNKKLTLLVLAAGTTMHLQSQNFVEDFTSPWNPNAQGWNIQNLSATPNPTLAWFQGNGAATFTAYNGGIDDYVAANYNSTQSNVGATISTWLITPTLNIKNGGVLSFATRINSSPTQFPDRLEVYLSTAGSGTNVGTTPTSVGTFSTMLTSINPSLTGTGYPDIWTVYTVTLTGISTPTVGRVGFRYYVTNGGPNGVNSDYIGLDAVRYSSGCGASINSYTICSGSSATLTAVDVEANATYTWMPGGQNTSSIVVNPGATTVYSLNYTESSGACPTATAAVTIGNNLSFQVNASASTVCAGQSVTLTATSAANAYTWLPTGGTSTVAVVNPTANTVYTVAGAQGLTCFGANTIAIFTNSVPVLSVTGPTLYCTTGTSAQVVFTGQGASFYTWSALNGQFQISQPSFTLNAPATVTAPITFTYNLLGFANNGCSSQITNSLYISSAPTVSASASKSIECVNKVINLNANGASSYSWTGESTSGTQSFTFNTGSTPGAKSWTVVGYSAEGCASANSAVVTMTVDACVGISRIDNSQKVSLFPNPFHNELQVNDLQGQIVIYNSLGQQVAAEQVKGQASINTQSLPCGVYIIKAINNSGDLISTSRLVKE